MMKRVNIRASLITLVGHVKRALMVTRPFLNGVLGIFINSGLYQWSGSRPHVTDVELPWE